MRKWIDESHVLDRMRQLGLQDDEVQVTKLLSPAQMEKALKRAGMDGMPDELWEKKSSGYNLAPDSDPRPAMLLGPGTEFIDHSELEKLL